MSATAPEKLAYNMDEVTEVLGVSIWSVRGLITRGELRHVRAGDRVLIPRDALKDYLAGKQPRTARSR